jgi:hypothetical protein
LEGKIKRRTLQDGALARIGLPARLGKPLEGRVLDERNELHAWWVGGGEGT